jgi:hypothetical protein
MVAAHPFVGVGPGNWEVAFPLYVKGGDDGFDAEQWRPTQRLLNQDLLAAAAERGLIGSSLAIALAFVVGYCLFGRRQEAAWTVALGAGILALGLFDSVLQLPTPAVLAAVAFGTSLPAERIGVHLGWQRPLVAVAIAVAFAMSAAWELRSLGALAMVAPTSGLLELERAGELAPDRFEIQMDLAAAHLSDRNCGAAKAHILAALRVFPHHPMPHRLNETCSP